MFLMFRDVSATSKEHRTLEPVRVFTGHSSVVEDVDWHWHRDGCFASVGDDGMLCM